MSKLRLILTFLVIIILVTAVVSYGWLRSSLPQVDGEITTHGINDDITIARDTNGVPHITAKTSDDLMFGLGFAHAQDRLWQMDMNRRIGMGRLSEVVGAGAVSADKLFRTLNFAGKSQKAFENLPAEGKQALLAYAEGVNAYLATHKGALPIEFLLTDTTPEPWQPMHSIVWLKMMSYDLGGNMRSELARAELMTKLTPDQVQEMYPTYPGDPAEEPLPNFANLLKDVPVRDLASLLPEQPESLGSNNWVIAGENTASGKPLLANDPHLTLRTPSLWYLAHLRLEEGNAVINQVGVSLPGVPMIVLGRTDDFAMAFTNTAPDVQDLFIEKVINGGESYLTPDGEQDFVLREEIIKVKDGEDVSITVRETRHGPVVSDIFRGLNDTLDSEHVLALQWTALDDVDKNIMLGLLVNRVKSFDDYVEAAKNFTSPQQNQIYADVSGNIGYYAPAMVPIRHPDNKINGRMPSPGWDAKYDWQGYIPYDELPKHYNPEGGVIITANEKIVDNDYPYYITRDWSLPYRGDRIRELMAARKDHDLASMAAIQNDTVSLMVQELKPIMLSVAKGIPSDIRDALTSWNGDLTVDSAEAAIFHAWMSQLMRKMTADELGDLAGKYMKVRPKMLKNILLDVGGQSRWCDNITTAASETCGQTVDSAFDSALTQLTQMLGSDWTDWQYGDVHVLAQIHTPFSNVENLRDIFQLSEPHGGGTYTVNVAGRNRQLEDTYSHGPSYRGIFDLSDLEKSLYIQPSGQSGNIFSEHYDDLFPLWSRGEYFTIQGNQVIPDNVASVLTLKPADTQ